MARSTLLGICCLTLLTLLPSRKAHAAEITRVASSFEKDDPFDLDFDIGFKRTQRRGKITRERHQDRHIADVIELRYTQVTQELPMRISFGIFRDLELHVGTSVIFNKDSNWGFPGLNDNGEVVTDNRNSTITNNCITSRGGLTKPSCKGDSRDGAQAIFDVPGQSFRGGLDNITLGVSWAVFNDAKDDTKPKWVWTFDYGIPSATVNRPGDPTSEAKHGEIGDKIHRFTLATALSKRVGQIDPYARLAYTLPTVAPGAWSNCNDPSKLGYAENCDARSPVDGKVTWTARETGIKPTHLAQLLFGAEIYAYDEPDKQQRVGFDIQFGANYISEGRTYNELSDALGKLNSTEEYLSLGGSLGLYARAAQYVQLRIQASLYHDTEHFLTNESVGKDLDGQCKGGPGSCVDLDNGVKDGKQVRPAEINPTFDFRYDMPGRRFRISEVNIFTISATGTINF